MRRTIVITKRELLSFFFSPMAYVIGFLFILFRGWEAIRWAQIFAESRVEFDQFPAIYTMGLCGQMMLILAPPLLTMRLLAEEKQSGSMELLMTAPVGDWEVVLGKWLASLVFYLVLWLPSLVLLLLLQASWLLDQDLSLGPVFTIHLWVFLAGGLFLSVGLFCSSFTKNQLVASLSAIVTINALVWTPHLLSMFNQDPKEGIWADLFSQVSVLHHGQESFGKGLIDSSHIWFYLSATAVFLFFTVRSVEARKWV